MIEAGTNNDAIDIRISRHRHDGITLNVRVWPEVEAFFEHWAGGMQERPNAGRLWRSRDGSPVTLWSLGVQSLNPSATRPYTLLHGGSGFSAGDHGYVNISFIRLVGASRPEGVDVIVESLVGRGEISNLAQRISEACNLFYSEYLQQVNMRAVVSVMSMPTERAA